VKKLYEMKREKEKSARSGGTKFQRI